MHPDLIQVAVEMLAVEAHGLTKRFGELTAVDHVDLEIKEGEIYGFLGPNGAGKTVTLSLIIGLVKPTEGAITLFGYDVVQKPGKVREMLGLVSQETALYEELTAQENLMFHAKLYGVPARERSKRIDSLLDLVQLTDRKGSRVSAFSGGMKRRLALARALLHDPELIVFDEPTIGLDPQGRFAILDRILALKKQGKTILLSTNDMEEADYVCDRIAVMDLGRIVAVDTPTKLKQMLGGDIVVLELVSSSEEVITQVNRLDFVKGVEKHDARLVLVVERGEEALPLLTNILSRVGIRSIGMRKPNLADVFFKLTGRALRE